MSVHQTARPTIQAPTPKGASSAGHTHSLDGHGSFGSHRSRAVEGTTSPQAKPGTTAIDHAPAGIQTSHAHSIRDAQRRIGVADDLPGGHGSRDGQRADAAGEQDGRARANVRPTPTGTAPVLADPFLALAADVLDDLEKVRIANENRLRQLTRTEADADGEERGFGLDESHPDVARLAALVSLLADAEHKAGLNLARQLRKHPLYPWLNAQKGVGAKQAARLLAAIGDPYWNDAENRPRRGPAELWAYCGLVPGQKRRRGERSNWSATAKMRAWNIAGSMLKAGNREIYDRRKAATEGRLHAGLCVRCGPSGHPAPAGTPWSDGHRHADALRIVSKELLKALWRESKRLHNSLDGHAGRDAQTSCAVEGPDAGGPS